VWVVRAQALMAVAYEKASRPIPVSYHIQYICIYIYIIYIYYMKNHILYYIGREGGGGDGRLLR